MQAQLSPIPVVHAIDLLDVMPNTVVALPRVRCTASKFDTEFGKPVEAGSDFSGLAEGPAFIRTGTVRLS